MAMAGARAVVAQGRLAGHHHHHPLEEEKLVAGAEVVAGVAGSEERLEVAEMVGVDHDHHPLQEEKLVAGAGAEGCVEGLVWEGRDLAYFDLLLHKLLANMAETIVSHES